MAVSLNLDARDIPLTQSGVEGFYWPLARKEQQLQRDTTLAHLTEIVRNGIVASDEDKTLLRLFYHWILAESISLYRAAAIVRRAARDSVSVQYPRESMMYAYTQSINQQSLDSSRLVKILAQGPVTHGALLSPIVKSRRYLLWNGVSKTSLLGYFQKEILACHRTPLLDLHAKMEHRLIKQTLFEDWFQPIGHFPKNQPIRSSVIDECIEAVRVGFLAGNEVMPTSQVRYLRGLIQEMSRYVRAHYFPLMRAPSRLPKELWTGSGGNIFSRMLRNAVRSFGGRVIGHEHGAGESHIQYFNAKPVIEYESCDTFFTYSRKGANALNSNFDSSLHLGREAPRIESLRQLENDAFYYSSFPKTDPHQVKNIMYPTTALLGERVTLDHFLGDYVYLDWSARLIGKISEFGYTVIHKPHPGGDIQYPTQSTASSGTTVLHEPFERVINKADAFVLDFSRSSTFPAALASTKPIVYIDFGLESWHEDARALLESRVKIVCGYIDARNRLQVDWDDVRQAVVDACELTNRTIVNEYYSHLCRR